MELKMNAYQLPEKITFNFEELKTELTAKTAMYETLVYTDDQITEAKKDRANLNKLKKALNDERIRLEKEYLEPFNKFKSEINEIIAIIDKPVKAIDVQVKEYEKLQKEKKIESVKEYFASLPVIEGFETLKFEQIYNPRWENGYVTMRAIQDEISGRISHIINDLATLSNLPEYGFESVEVYKTTLDLNSALNEGKRLADIQKRKAEKERLKAEAEAKQEELKKQVEEVNAPDGGVYVRDDDKQGFTYQEPKENRVWLGFKAHLTVEDALALKEFFNSRNIEFEAI